MEHFPGKLKDVDLVISIRSSQTELSTLMEVMKCLSSILPPSGELVLIETETHIKTNSDKKLLIVTHKYQSP